MSHHGHLSSFCDFKMYEAKLATRGEHAFYTLISISAFGNFLRKSHHLGSPDSNPLLRFLNESYVTCLITKPRHLIMILLYYMPPIRIKPSRKMSPQIKDSIKRPDETQTIYSQQYFLRIHTSDFKCIIMLYL